LRTANSLTASAAASSARRQVSDASVCSKEKVASMPLPMNLSTWPPRDRSAAVSVSKTPLSISTMTGPGAASEVVGGRREAANVGVPQHGAEAADGAALDSAGMDPPSRILAEIRSQQPRGDDVPGIRFHRQRQRRQRRLQKRLVIVGETADPIGDEGVDDPAPVGAVPVFPESEELREIVRRAFGNEGREDWKLERFRSHLETPAHPGIVLAAARPPDESVERAREPIGIVAHAVVAFRLNRVEIAPPDITVALPLRMKRFHRRVGAPQRHAARDQPLAIAVEQIVSRRAAQPLAHGPDMSLDNQAAQSAVESREREP
jgi:hypothetical protein